MYSGVCAGKWSRAWHVGHPEEPLPDVRCPDAVCAQYTMPNGVALAFQVCLYSIEPAVANRAFNLLTKDSVRATLADEPEERWPEVTGISFAVSFSSRTERLARATASPDRAVSIPVGELEGIRPPADSGEEVALGVVGKVIGFNFGYTAFVHIASWYLACADQFAQPSSGFGIVLIVVVHERS